MNPKPFLKLSALLLMITLCFFNGPSGLRAETPVTSENDGNVVLPPQTEPAPLTLEDCYHLALNTYETVAIQKEAIARANALMFTAASEALPEVDFVATREFQQNPKGSSNIVTTSLIETDQHQRSFTIKQPLFQGFKAVGAITGAGSYKKEQTENWIRTKELLYRDVALAFHGVLRYQKDLKIIRDIHDLLEKRIKELEDREKIGRSRASEVATATTGLKSLEADLAGAKGSLATYQYLLEYYIGMSLGNRKLQDNSPEDLSEKSLGEYLARVTNRPDVISAEQAIRTAKSSILVAQSGFWPTINLSNTDYTHRENFLANVDWDLLFTVNVPLFSGGATIGQVKDAVAVLKQKKLSFSLVKRQAELEIKQSYESWRYSHEQFRSLTEAVASAEENYKLQSEEYRRSLVNNLDVLTALQSLNQTRQNANQAFYQAKNDEARFKVAIGNVL